MTRNLFPRVCSVPAVILALFTWGCGGGGTSSKKPCDWTAILNNWRANGYVYTLEVSGDTLYLGGEFIELLPHTGFGAVLDPSTGTIPANRKAIFVNGAVHTAVSDGTGGWYIAGEFTKVGNSDRGGAARIRADGTLHPFDPAPDGLVRAFAVSGDKVYAGGDFTTIGGQARARIALLDASTGVVDTAWNPQPDLNVYGIALRGSVLYACGNFLNIGGQGRAYLAVLDAADGSNDKFDLSVKS